jgi:acetolactate synthase-1/2/3 large subunit
MVRQWQDMIYDGHRSGSAMGDPTIVDSAIGDSVRVDSLMAVKARGETDIYPDFVTIAAGYRVRAERVTQKGELAAAFARMLADPHEPYLLDVIVESEENVFPMIPAGGSYQDIIMSAADLAARARDAQGSNI